MIVGINLIALNAHNGTGPFTYIQRMLTQMGKYNIQDCSFIVYKQKQISENYLGIPDNIKVTYVNVPTLGNGIKRIIFEQTLFYFYIKKCDAFYSYCTSMPLFVHTKRYFTLHDVYFLSFKRRYGKYKTIYLKWITKKYIRQSDKVLTVSEYSKNEICELLNINRDKIYITYNFVLPPTACLKNVPTIKDTDGRTIDPNIKFFLYVGSLQPGKNIEGMVNGFESFLEHDSDWHLIIVGRPTHKGNEIIDFLKDKKNISYLGYQPTEVVNFLFSKCHATVLLSFCEGFGIPPIEGFYYDKPALVSNRTSLPEVVGDAGIKVNPYDIAEIADGFKQLATHRQTYIPFIKNQLRKFDPNKSVQTFMDTIGIPYLK